MDSLVRLCQNQIIVLWIVADITLNYCASAKADILSVDQKCRTGGSVTSRWLCDYSGRCMAGIWPVPADEEYPTGIGCATAEYLVAPAAFQPLQPDSVTNALPITATRTRHLDRCHVTPGGLAQPSHGNVA